jgi:hypothetical protein
MDGWMDVRRERGSGRDRKDWLSSYNHQHTWLILHNHPPYTKPNRSRASGHWRGAMARRCTRWGGWGGWRRRWRCSSACVYVTYVALAMLECVFIVYKNVLCLYVYKRIHTRVTP